MTVNNKSKFNIVFWIGLIFILTVPVSIGIFTEKYTIGFLAALCGAFVMAMAKIDSLAKLKLGPLEAEMREKIEEANATIEQLRDLAASITEAALSDLISGWFMKGMTFQKMLDIHNSLISSLHRLEVDPETIKNVETHWRKGLSVIYFRIIKAAVERKNKLVAISANASQSDIAAAIDLQDLSEPHTWSIPSPGEIRIVLSKHGIKNDIAYQWINDFEHFLTENEIPRKDEFLKQLDHK